MTTQKRAGDQTLTQPVMSVAIDDVGMAALCAQPGEPARCDLCARPITGKPSCSGLLMWSRGDELRFDQPPLCDRCAERIGVAAFARWTAELDGG